MNEAIRALAAALADDPGLSRVSRDAALQLLAVAEDAVQDDRALSEAFEADALRHRR